MILGVDLSSNQASFNFPLAIQQGVRAAYIKLGGDNIARYVSGSYAARVDAAHAAGVEHVGSYWVTGGHDPAAAADFYAAHLDHFGPADFIVLDNESLDSGNTYTDAEAAAWVRETIRVSGAQPAQVLHYGNKSLMESHGWPELLATGCSFLIADYNGTPLQGHIPSTIPAARVVGHQYADNGNLGGASPVDLNAFTDSFLAGISAAGLTSAPLPRIEDDEMIKIYSPNRQSALIGAGYVYPLDTDEKAAQAEAIATKVIEGNDRQYDLWMAMATQGRSVAAAPPVDYAKLATAIVAAGGTAPTVAQIAKAVNDDAAARLAK